MSMILCMAPGCQTSAGCICDRVVTVSTVPRIERLENALKAVQRARLNGLFDAAVENQLRGDVEILFAEIDSVLNDNR